MAGSYDFEEQERLAELKAWWEDNRWYVMGAIAAGVLAFAGFRGWQYWTATQAEDAGAMFAAATKAQKDQRVAGIDALVAKHPGSYYASEGQLVLAKEKFEGGDLPGAEKRLEWVMDRYTFGRPIGSYQAIKHRLADMKCWQEASHGLVDGAVRAVARDRSDADELCSGAKAYIGDVGPELCHECVQFHGGIGVTFEHDLHLYLRRVLADASTWGTVTEHRLRLTDLLDAKAVARTGSAA